MDKSVTFWKRVHKHSEYRKAWFVHIYYTWCDIILIFKLHRRTWVVPRSSIHGLKIQMTSHLCNKYEQITLSYLLSVNHNLIVSFKAVTLNIVPQGTYFIPVDPIRSKICSVFDLIHQLDLTCNRNFHIIWVKGFSSIV